MTTHRGAATPLVIENVTVVDGTDGPPKPGATVVLDGDRIEAVGPAAELTAPPGATVIDGAGRFLIPGLWDMHLHAFMDQGMADAMLPQLVAHGVTGIRDTHGEWEVVESVRAEIASGRRTGPRIMAPGKLLDGVPLVQPTGEPVETPEEGRDAVRARKRVGADYVKVYSRLSREAYFAIADECRKLNIPFAGHVPSSVTAAEASDAGQHCFEHLMGVEMAVSTEEDALREAQNEATGHFEPPDAALIERTYDPERAEALYEMLIRNRTWQCPTLSVHRAYAEFVGTDYHADPRFALLGSSTRQIWDWAAGMSDHPMFEGLKALKPVYARIAGEMWRAGVPMVAGTDTPNPIVYPGSSLHEELELLVGVGLTPLAALQAATREAARFRGDLDSHGTVEVGKVADLVLLDADPLADIRNTRSIAGVVLAGRYLDRAALDGLLEEAAEAAAGEPEGDAQEADA